MNVQAFTQAVGGRRVLISVTGLSKGRISQWVTDNHIPRSWVKFLELRFPVACRKHGIRDLTP
jgi:hypothetical protein